MSSRRILFMPCNGTGLGHLTRCLAIARRLPEDVEPVLFTQSEGAPLAMSQGFLTEYLPGPGVRQFGDPQGAWDRRLTVRLTSILETYRPSVVLFDGPVVYPGVARASWRLPRIPFVWCRRALWKQGRGEAALIMEPVFSFVLEPGDFADAEDRGPTVARRGAAVRVPPVLFHDETEMLDRVDAQRALGLDPDRLNVLMSLGAGTINDTRSPLGTCIEALTADPRVRVAIAHSAIAGRRPVDRPGVVLLDRYPLTPYLRAFDFAVTAAGYNTVHELLLARVPALLVPNLQTKRDDQALRARVAVDRGLALSWEPGGAPLAETVRAGLDDVVRDELAFRLRRLRLVNGAQAAAERLADLSGMAA